MPSMSGTDDNLDLYVLGTVALAFTVLAGEAEALGNSAAPHDPTVGDVETAGN